MSRVPHQPTPHRNYPRSERRLWLRLLIPATVLLVFLAVSTLGFHLLDSRYSWIDAFYMTVISVTTTGFREIHAPDWPVMLWTSLVILVGLTLGAVTLSMVVAAVVEGQVRRILGRRQLERKISSLDGHVILCGYGAMGSVIARDLVRSGRQVVVIDQNPDRTAAAEQADLLYIVGDAQTEEVLSAAGLERASALIASLTTDAENVFLTLTARQMRPSLRIIARAQNVWAQDKLSKAGATRVICPQVIGATQIVDVVLRPAVVDFVEMAHKGVDLELDQLRLGEESGLIGRSLRELELPRRIGVQVVAVLRSSGQAIYQPRSDLRLEPGDTLILIGKRGAANAVQQMQVEQGDGAETPPEGAEPDE
jgi:voltage-gated potassium channel